MKKKYLIIIFSILTLKIYSQEIEYFFTQECCSSSSEIFSLVAKIENNYDYSIISENDILKINTNNIKSIWGISFTGYNNDDDYISEISLNTGSGVISYPLDYLKLVNGITIPGITIDSTKKYKKESMLLLPSYYYEVLKTNNINTLFKYETYWKNGYYDNINNNRYDSWAEIFYPNCILITNSYVCFYKSDCEKDDYLHNVTGLIIYLQKLNENKYKIEFYTLPSEDYSNGADATFESLNSKQNHYIILEYDGDYVNIYLDSETNRIDTYVISSDLIESKLKQLAENNSTTTNDITWPRHADGSCDYDGSKKIAAVQTVKATPSTNVAQNKTMTVTENLKLRSGEATTSDVITVMSAGTKVKILELGKAENIDGINSNWVKVEVQAGAKDRDGKTITKGTVGWCFGGYLK